MTIRNVRDHGQRYRPRMACLKKVEAVVLEMQDPKTGVKSQTQRLVITTIPHAITGEDIVAWIANRFKIDALEARAMGTMMVAFGYIYPLQDHKRLILKPDTSLYRFQEEYNNLYKWMNHKWDFIVMQAKEQYRAGKERKKPDRVVFDCQERAYWVVHRPPPGTVSAMDYGHERMVDPNLKEVKVWKTEMTRWSWRSLESTHTQETGDTEGRRHIGYRTFLARGAPRWINIDGKTMDVTVKGLAHPHRYVLDAAQTHIYMLMKKDSFGRYLKSPVFKETQKKAIAPEAHRFSEAQLEQNAKRRRPSLSPIILRQQEEEQKAKLAATGPVDITQLCRFTAPVPHLAVYTGICEAQSTASPGLMTLPNSAACPSPISVAIDSTPASERRFDGNGGPSSSHFPSIAEASVSEEDNQPPAPKSRMALSLSRFLRRGCNAPSVFASLSPKCGVASGGGKVQPLGVEPLAQPQPRRIANFFQIKVDIPPECRIYPIDSEDEEDDSPDTARGAQEAKRGEELSPGSMVSAVGNSSVPSPQSEAVASELQELSLQSVPSLLPLKERKNAVFSLRSGSGAQGLEEKNRLLLGQNVWVNKTRKQSYHVMFDAVL
ncbi:Regulator of G-protein signaling 9 [Anabarilius grahami]|uniref:Regulator of G-protein signaling 9 n=1 Tax=Anabarilius grahami TaxID=495550 RepID=A0A3N0YZE9_ANAGA|nr:Regulator of G-protein signaling 9 [Anabarilius grahami]